MAQPQRADADQRNARAGEAPDEKPKAVRVRMLGGFSVSVGAQTIEEGDWRLNKARSLVKLMALAPGHRMRRERIVEELWPELGSEAAANNLRRTLHAARHAFEPVTATPSRYLHLRNEELAMCPEGALWVDVEVFEEAADTARRTRDPAAYRAAVELYGGELLPEDLFEAWAEDRREELRETYLTLLVELAEVYEERGEYRPGIEALKRALSEEPTHEGAHVSLMSLYALSGRRREALRQYDSLSRVLSRELGVEPDADTKRLHEQILSGRLPSVRPSWEDRPLEEAPDAGLHNLPAVRGSFVGREQDVVEVRRLLVMTDLLTLTGSGGSGKSRLALEVAKDLVGLYPDGVWLVELAGLSEGALVPQAVASALGEREQPGRPLTDTLVRVLRPKKTLLVLDNCEHLVDAVGQLADTLLSSCPGLRVLATSREPLNVAGEAIWQVASLSVPDAGSASPPEAIKRYESVRLFVDRAHLKLAGFEVTPANAGAVAEVCRKLDGIPLAIELAAARLTALTVEQLAERLEDSLKLLTGGARTAAPRHRTMRATLEWSHDLLDERERKLFGRLSIFAGGWTLEAAEAVGADGGIDEGDVLDLLGRLIDKSLVVAGDGADGTPRYRMLEPVRQYAREKLEESEEAGRVHKRHAEHYLALARRAEQELSGPDQTLWLDQLEIEHDNLRAALRWSLDGEEVELGLRLAGALWLFWYTRGYLSEGRDWLEKAASTGGALSHHQKARALHGAGYMVARQGNLGAAKELLEEALALFREMEDKEGVASTLVMLGMTIVHGQQDLETVPALHEEAMNLKPEIQDPRTLGYLLLFSGIIAVSQGDWERADALQEESLKMFREVRDIAGINASLTNLGLSALAQARYSKASALLRENLRVIPESDKAAIMYNFLGLACAASAQGQPVRAARLWGAAEAIQEVFDMQLLPMTRARLNYDEHVGNARSQLDEVAFEATWAEGKAMTHEDAVRFALGSMDPIPPKVLDRESTLAVSGSDAGLARMRAEALNRAGYLAIFQDEYKTAKGLLEEALTLYRELEDEEGVAASLTYLGLAAVLAQQDLKTIPALLEEASSLRPGLSDRHTIGMMLIVSGLLAGSMNDWQRAEVDHEEALQLFREIRDSRGMSMCTGNLGLIALVRADYDRATELLKENLHMSRVPDYKAGIHYSLFGLAGVAARQRGPTRAARLWGAAETMRKIFGIYLSPMAHHRLDYEGDIATIRSWLGEAAFASAWAEGEAMTQDEAIEYALGSEVPASVAAPAADGEPLDGFTGREREIIGLVARGLTTNRQLSAELSISERTVETHIRNILKKLGLKSRAQLAAWAADRS